MAKVTERPEASVVLEQLLRAYAQGSVWGHIGRSYLPYGGVSLLHASGLALKRARAINILAQRQAKAWRKAGEPVSDEQVSDTARRLLV